MLINKSSLLICCLLSIHFETLTAICGDKDKRDKSCGSFSTCADCVECESQCAWCAIGASCNRFCFDSADKKTPCMDDGCVKATEFKCMTITTANYANTDYDREGGITLEKKPKDELDRATMDQEARKDRHYDPFAWVSKDITDKKYCPDCKLHKWLGRDDSNRKGGDPSSSLRGQ
jgi:hypothetical protein